MIYKKMIQILRYFRKNRKKINDLCDHNVVVDWIDDVIGDDVIKIKYCRICELNMYKFTHDHCYSCQ